MEKQYYIISIKHTSKGDTALTFFGPGNCGYTWHRDRVGVYNEEEIKLFACDNLNVAVDKGKVDRFWMNALDFYDKYISVPNTPTVLHHLGISNKLMKPKKFAGCRMTFINSPIELQEVQVSDTTEAK